MSIAPETLMSLMHMIHTCMSTVAQGYSPTWLFVPKLQTNIDMKGDIWIFNDGNNNLYGRRMGFAGT